MKKNASILVCTALFLGAIILGFRLSRPGQHDPRDLGFWIRAGAGNNWSSEAARGTARAQFQLGLNLVATNLVTMIDRVAGLSRIPLLGKLFFEKTTYAIDTNASAEQLTLAYSWIKKSADQGFAPAKEAEKLFMGRVGSTQGMAPVVVFSGKQVTGMQWLGEAVYEPYFTRDNPISGSTSPARPGGAALNAAQATELAEKLANDRTEALYKCRPFFDSPPARPFGTAWRWQAHCGHRLVDFEATVTFAGDGSNPSVHILLLDSRAVAPLLQRLR